LGGIMKRLARFAAALVLLVLVSGCSTIQSKYGSKHRDEHGMPPQFGYAYSGMVSWTGNWCYFVSPNMEHLHIKFIVAPLMFVFLLVDLPLSAAADTIVLPFELFHEPTTPRLTLTDECNYSSMKLIKD
jgi:uncharacterized protein YceK